MENIAYSSKTVFVMALIYFFCLHVSYKYLLINQSPYITIQLFVNTNSWKHWRAQSYAHTKMAAT